MLYNEQIKLMCFDHVMLLVRWMVLVMFDTFYGLTVDEVLIVQVQELERENRMAAHLMVLRDGFQVEHHIKLMHLDLVVVGLSSKKIACRSCCHQQIGRRWSGM